MKTITPSRVWDIYQKYDYMGEKYKYKFLIFRDNGIRELAIDNANTGHNIESVTMTYGGIFRGITKKKFISLVNRIIRKKPANLREWLSD